MKHSKADYNKLIDLYSRQNWLINKKEQLYELLDFCENSDNKEIVFSLLKRFHYLTNDTLKVILDSLCDYIIQSSSFIEEKTQILSLTYDDDADSGQKILDQIKLPLFQKGWRNVKLVNQFGKCYKYCKSGKTQIVIVDEFIGSGKTLRTRLDYLKNNLKEFEGEYQVLFCFVAGTEETIKTLTSEGIDIFCALPIEKGISGFFEGHELTSAIDSMVFLENKLAKKINTKELSDYNFGYGKAEALYSLEGCNGNTPNSVFPIFWWLEDNLKKSRKTLLTRYEKGF